MMSRAENNSIAESGSGGMRGSPPVGMVRENLVQVIWRSRWIVLVSVVASMSIGLMYINGILPLYTSTSKIYVEQSGPKILTEAEGVMTQSKNYLYTQAELLKSTPILLAALKQTGIRRLKILEKVDNPVTYLKEKGLDVSVGNKDDIISISFDSPDPCEAAEFVNAVVDSYITYHSKRRQSTSSEILRILQQQKRVIDEELSQKLKAMAEFKSENSALAFEHQNSNIILDALAKLTDEMRQAQLETIDTKSAFETVKSMVDDPAGLNQLIEAEGATGVCTLVANERTRLKTELEQLQGQLAALDQRITPNHPWMRTLRQKLDRTQANLNELEAEFARAQLTIAKRRYEAAVEREEQISGDFEEQYRRAIELNKGLAEYRILESDWQQTNKLSDILDDRIGEINVTEDVGCLYISVLELAQPADEPSGPPKAKYMAFALIAGIMLAVGLIALRDYMDQWPRSAERVSAVLGIPFWGMVPSMFGEQNVAVWGRKVFLDPKSCWAQAYRRICRAILFGVPGAMAKTILVTSPTTADGKSTLASNLAIAMAQAGQKTLILDADFGNSIQHKIFGVSRNDVGLSTTLAGITASKAAIQSTGVKGLDLLPSGPEVPHPSEMLNSDRLTTLLEILSDRYDRVIVDAPAIVPVTDAQTLAAICHMTVLVVRIDRATRKKSRQARDGLLSAGARIVGVIVNNVPKQGGHSYYNAYGQNDGWNGSVGPVIKDVNTYVNDVSRSDRAGAIARDSIGA